MDEASSVQLLASGTDPELTALESMASQLDGFDDTTRHRILLWLVDRYHVTIPIQLELEKCRRGSKSWERMARALAERLEYSI
ncbi:hypothetical protein [Sinomonas mesophila]|uniref:hypothetical protein n=1 Tax=Sinomonas mesophila TaxID=1531955 RepID=UPI000985C6DD|nr:hypothetical protein [Sinomonas mesophila]